MQSNELIPAHLNTAGIRRKVHVLIDKAAGTAGATVTAYHVTSLTDSWRNVHHWVTLFMPATKRHSFVCLI